MGRGLSKSDEGKRFCTPQLYIRCFNGGPTELYNGQPWHEVCFRGQEKVLKQEERAAWNKFVHVRFQPKAWYDDALYVLRQGPEVLDCS